MGKGTTEHTEHTEKTFTFVDCVWGYSGFAHRLTPLLGL